MPGGSTYVSSPVQPPPLIGGHENHDKDGRPMIQLLSERFPRGEDGQGLAEYALILALIAVIAIVALLFLGGSISSILNTVGSSV